MAEKQVNQDKLERMDGFVDLDDRKDLRKSIIGIISDMKEEGFDDMDIKEYIHHIINKEMRGLRCLRG